MSEPAAQRALNASTAALVVCGACIFAFLPPMVQETVASIPRTVLIGLALVTAMLLHWVFLGIALRRMHRAVFGWVALAVLLFPIGGIAALMLLGFFGSETESVPPSWQT